MKYVIETHKGVNDVLFGLSRSDIRKLISAEFKEFKRNEYSENTTDFYPAKKMFLEYDKSNNLTAIEFSYCENLIFEGIDLFNNGFTQLVSAFRKRSKKMELEDEVSAIFYDLGIGITRNPDEETLVSVIIFSKDYYE